MIDQEEIRNELNRLLSCLEISVQQNVEIINTSDNSSILCAFSKAYYFDKFVGYIMYNHYLQEENNDFVFKVERVFSLQEIEEIVERFRLKSNTEYKIVEKQLIN